MKYTCGACHYKADSEDMTVLPGDQEGEVNVHCPRCFNLLVTYSEQTEPVDDCSNCEIDKYLPTTDQCRYSLHLYGKQKEKLVNALNQIEGMITKTQIMMELAQEKEAFDGRNDTD